MNETTKAFLPCGLVILMAIGGLIGARAGQKEARAQIADSTATVSKSGQQEKEFSPFVDKDGNIERPKDYKIRWSPRAGQRERLDLRSGLS
jgi:hypothetical protein